VASWLPIDRVGNEQCLEGRDAYDLRRALQWSWRGRTMHYQERYRPPAGESRTTHTDFADSGRIEALGTFGVLAAPSKLQAANSASVGRLVIDAVIAYRATVPIHTDG
jgi:hypothetical protein